MKHLFSSQSVGLGGQGRVALLLAGLGLLALPALAQPTVSSVTPTRNQRNAPRASNVTFTLSQTPSAGSAAALKVFGNRRGGLLTGTASVNGNSITFDPGTDFQPGETVQATLTTAAQNTTGQSLAQGYVVSFIAAATNGAGSFTAAPSLTVPTNGQGPAVGDIDGDGLADIVIGTGSNTLATFLNQGGGLFTAAPSASVATGSGPSQVVLADVDNDGDLDAVVPSFNAGGVSVHRNVGGVLGAATLLSTGNGFNPRIVALADVNGDAYLDILTGLANGSNIMLNLNNAGTFAAATVASPVGAAPYALAAADLNGDGRMDFIAGNANSNSLSVRLGNGNGTFASTGTINTGPVPFGLALGDLNGDNIPDLVTGNRFSGQVNVGLGAGDGAFGTLTTVATGGAEAIDVALADVDADGDLDLMVANFGSANVSVLRNNGAGTFGTASTYAASTNPFALATGDLDGNGSIDLVCGNVSSTSVTVLRNGALTDLTVSTTADIPAGAYNNITVTGSGVGTVTGPVTVAGSFTVQAGGVLVTNCQSITGSGSFILRTGAELRICDAAGISQSGATGAVQVTGARSFSPGARYTYNGTAGQVTGNGLPALVRELTVSNGSGVTLSAATSVAQVLRLTTGVLSTGGQNLTLLSTDSTGTALAVNGTGSVTGSVTVQRYISPGLNGGPGYRHYAAPVTNSTVADLTTAGFTPLVNPVYNGSTTPNLVTPFPTVFGYDEARVLTSPATTYSAFDKGWVSPTALTDPLTPGRGYTVNIAASEKVDFVGTLVDGPVSRVLTRNGGAAGGLFLVGNPYPAPLDWSLMSIPTGLDNAMYVFQSTSQYGGAYRSYVNGFGDPLISSGQGFFVRLSAGSNAVTLEFTNAARVTTYASQVAFNRGAETRPVVQLSLQGSSALTDEVYVYQEAGATAGVDATYDAAKLANPNGLNLAAVSAGRELAINGLPLLSTSTVVPLTVTVPQTGLYTLRAAALLNLAAGTVYLHDALTGQDVDLRQQPSYGFSASALSLPGRFALRFEPGRPTATHGAQAAFALDVYPNPARGSFTLLLPAVAGASQAQATLLNALGQRVHAQSVALPATGTRATIDAGRLAAGVYVLQVRIGEHTVSRRVTLY